MADDFVGYISVSNNRHTEMLGLFITASSEAPLYLAI